MKQKEGKMQITNIRKIEQNFYKAEYPDCVEDNYFYKIGLMVFNDYVYDLSDCFEIIAHVSCSQKNTYEMCLDMVKNCSPKPELHSQTLQVVNTLKTGEYILHFPISQFDVEQGQYGSLQFVRGLTLKGDYDFELKKVECKKGKRIAISCPIRSKPGVASEWVSYEGKIQNCSEEDLMIHFSRKAYGWEAMHKIKLPADFLLKKEEQQNFTIQIMVEEGVVPGGFEKQKIYITPDCYGEEGEILELQTVRAMQHPFVIMNKEEMEAVQEKIQKYDWAKEVFEYWTRLAEEWEVPEIDATKPYCFITKNSNYSRGAATIFYLSKDRELEEKVTSFLKKFACPDTGYLKTLYAGSQELVHEGEFFKCIAIIYDYVYDSPLLTKKDHINIENAMRTFMNYIHMELQKGEISNWTLAESAGALYCACVLQDRERVERFLFGVGGISEHLRIGTMSDGWWYESSIGYNLLCAGLFCEISQVVSHWGIDFKNIQVPACYAKRVNTGEITKDGLVIDNWGPNTKNFRNIKMIWDSLLYFYDYRGVIMGINDSSEMQVEGISSVLYDSRFDIAYYLYGAPEYAYLLHHVENLNRDLLFGVGEIPYPEMEEKPYQKSFFADNGGAVILRSKKKGVTDREQLQVGLKYGSHGGAHGHYDRVSMRGLMRYGKSLTNPQNIWYSYHTMMYKFYVQNSIAHNMVVVDLKQQDPKEPKRFLFYEGERMQVCGLENKSSWCNPPYGGWQVAGDKEFKVRCFHEGRFVPIPDNPPEYSTRTGFTEEVLSRRVTVLTDDYVVHFDYVEGDEIHTYDCLYHFQGLNKVEGLTGTGFSEKLEENPLSSAQFITDCSHYQMSEGAKLSFQVEYTDEQNNGNKWLCENRTGFNERGIIKTDLYLAYPLKAEVVIGCDPEYEQVSKDLYYSVKVDGLEKASGAFGAWILGREEVEIDVSNSEELELSVMVKEVEFEPFIIYESAKTVFWGDPKVITKEGKEYFISELPISFVNTDPGNGIGTDYYGGPIKLQAKPFLNGIPAEPLDRNQWGSIRVSLKGMEAERFTASIGGDYPLGKEEGRRRTVCYRQQQEEAFFITVVEPYETEPQIKEVKALGNNTLKVTLHNEAVQHIRLRGLETGNVEVEMEEYLAGNFIFKERTKV